jgi:hypothetical protein
MPLETGTTINDLTVTNPTSSDPVGQGDDHLRLIKACVQGSLPNLGTVLGRPVRQDVAVSISSTWNTNLFMASGSATTTVVMTLPPSASITAGFYVDFLAITNGNISVVPSGTNSINGTTAMAVINTSFARAVYIGNGAWTGFVFPANASGGGYIFNNNVRMDGTLSVSGAATLASTLTVSGAASLLSTLSVSGQATFKSGVSISGTVIVTGNLSISGNAMIAGNLSISGNALINGNLGIAGTLTVSSSVVLLNGQIKFPASQNASTDANTLDDYEEGTWTPAISFGAPGDQSLAYSSRTGVYQKVGKQVHAAFNLTTSTFTHTTAAGSLFITGWPFASADVDHYGAVSFSQMSTGAGALQARLAVGVSNADVVAAGVTNNAQAALAASNHVSGNNVAFMMNITYRTTA